MISRQPKIHAGLRMVAAGCIALWLVAVSRCGINHLCGCDHQHADVCDSGTLAHHDCDHSEEAEAAEHAHGEASDSHDSGQPSNDSHHHNDGDNSCCSTLVATAQIAQTFFFDKPPLQPLNFPCPFLPAHNPTLAASENMPQCHANRRDWVLTPEVCLGPAHASLAPPSLVS